MYYVCYLVNTKIGCPAFKVLQKIGLFGSMKILAKRLFS